MVQSNEDKKYIDYLRLTLHETRFDFGHVGVVTGSTVCLVFLVGVDLVSIRFSLSPV